MSIFHWRREAEPIRPGFNFYPPDDPSSRGCILQLGPWRFRVRWSKPQRHWVLSAERFPA